MRELAEEISRDYEGKDLLLVGVLKGAVFFLSDLMRHLDVQLRGGLHGRVVLRGVDRLVGRRTHPQGPRRPIQGREVLIVEDIVDSGLTLSYLFRMLRARGPASLEVCALLTKPERREIEMPIRYVGFEIPNRFAIGYGLDFAERYRNLPYVAVLEDDAQLPNRQKRAIPHCYALVSPSERTFETKCRGVRRGLTRTLVSRFFKSAAFPILIVVVLAFFAQKLISPDNLGGAHLFGVPHAGRGRQGQGRHAQHQEQPDRRPAQRRQGAQVPDRLSG